MRGTRAKQLRKLAEQLTVGKDRVKYEERALNPRRPTARTRFLWDCTKLVHKNLKLKYMGRLHE